MASKARTKTASKETVDVVTEETQIAVRCLSWCFLPGISHIGQYGLLQCVLSEGHEENGEEHQIKVEILSPPAGTFTINWTVGK